MAKLALVRQGDRTTHGGTVLTGDSTFIIDGKAAARVGDLVLCPRCKGSFPIVSGAHDAFSGQHIARHDDLTACGAKLIASQNTTTWSDVTEAEEMSSMASVPASDYDLPDEEEHTVRFQAIDPETDKPAPKCVYILTRENGVQHGGITDNEGFTEIIQTTRPEQISVHFMFKTAKGDTIEREEMT